MVRTLRCGRSNPGSNPGHDTVSVLLYFSTPTPTPTSTPFWFSWRFISIFLFDKGKKITVKDFLFKCYREFSFFLLLLLAFSACVFVCFYFSFLFFSFLFPVNKNVKKKNAVRPRAAKFCKLTVQSRRGWGGERKKERPRFNSLWFPPSSSRLLHSPRGRKGRRTA